MQFPVQKSSLMKKPISATIDENLIRWMEAKLKDKIRYRNKSHLIEIALTLLKEKEESSSKRGDK